MLPLQVLDNEFRQSHVAVQGIRECQHVVTLPMLTPIRDIVVELVAGEVDLFAGWKFVPVVRHAIDHRPKEVAVEEVLNHECGHGALAERGVLPRPSSGLV
jgi:hypothetical protein